MTNNFKLKLLLLWLAGNSLRLTILAVPPVLPAIHRDLHLDETTVGLVTAMPVLLLALGAVFGSLLVSKLGGRRGIIIGLCLVALAGALRGIGPSTPLLLGMTFLMGIGVSISQPTLPSLVLKWLPSRTGTATAVYANGLLVGEILAAALTTPVVLPLVGGHWEWVFVIWSVPVLATAVAIWLLTDHDNPRSSVSVRWWPDWRSGLTWRLGLILGCASAGYFGCNAFIPDYLKAIHAARYIPAALTSLNLLQFPASLLTAFFPKRLIGRPLPIVGAGIGVLVSTIGFRMGGIWVVGWAGILGFCTAWVLVLSLALPPLLAHEDAHRLTAAMFTITYACAFVASLIGGAIWDATGIPISSFLPVSVAGVVMVMLVYGLDLSPARRALASTRPAVASE